MKNLVVTEEIWKEGNMYTAYCPELDVASCGQNIEEARKNLLEVIEIHLEEAAKLGTLKAFLEDAGYDLNTSQPPLQLDKQVVAFNRETSCIFTEKLNAPMMQELVLKFNENLC